MREVCRSVANLFPNETMQFFRLHLEKQIGLQNPAGLLFQSILFLFPNHRPQIAKELQLSLRRSHQQKKNHPKKTHLRLAKRHSIHFPFCSKK